jgi:hypothetical protein
MIRRFTLGLGLLVLVLSSSCMTAYRQTVGSDGSKVFSRVFLTDYLTAWQAVLESMKSLRIDVKNQEGGFIQTRWVENTSEKAFVDSYGGAESYLKAQYRLKVSVAKAFHNGQPAVKVAIQKEQVIQRDVLEGWKTVDTDSLEENSLLYRMGRLVYMRMKLAKLEEEKNQRALQEATGEVKATP